MEVARESALGTCDYESNSPFLPPIGYEIESKSHFTSLSLGFLACTMGVLMPTQGAVNG